MALYQVKYSLDYSRRFYSEVHPQGDSLSQEKIEGLIRELESKEIKINTQGSKKTVRLFNEPCSRFQPVVLEVPYQVDFSELLQPTIENFHLSGVYIFGEDKKEREQKTYGIRQEQADITIYLENYSTLRNEGEWAGMGQTGNLGIRGHVLLGVNNLTQNIEKIGSLEEKIDTSLAFIFAQKEGKLVSEEDLKNMLPLFKGRAVGEKIQEIPEGLRKQIEGETPNEKTAREVREKLKTEGF